MADPDTLFEMLVEQQRGKRYPPVHLWNPDNQGASEMRIDADGSWYHQGQKIKREALVNLFATILRKDGDRYFLVTPAEKLDIEVADVPFVVTDLDVRGEAPATQLLFTTNVGDYVVADADHAIRMTADRPYLHIRDGLEAVVNRNVFYRLIEVGVEEGGELYVYSKGVRFSLGPTS